MVRFRLNGLCKGETPHLTLQRVFLTGISIKKPPPPPYPGHREQKKARCEWEFTTQYSQSSLFISETLNKGYQMIISKLNESVICFGSFLIIQELNKRL